VLAGLIESMTVAESARFGRFLNEILTQVMLVFRHTKDYIPPSFDIFGILLVITAVRVEEIKGNIQGKMRGFFFFFFLSRLCLSFYAIFSGKKHIRR
jgi:hypothetical protein